MANLLETQLQGLLPKFYRVNSRMLGDDLSLSDEAYYMTKYVMYQIYIYIYIYIIFLIVYGSHTTIKSTYRKR